jgi:hypothetical protein
MDFQRGKALSGNSVRPTRRLLFIQAKRPIELEVIEVTEAIEKLLEH